MKRSKYTLKLLVKIEVLYQSGFQKTFPSNDPLLWVFCFVCFFLSQSWTFCQFTREVFSLFRTNKKAMFSKKYKMFQRAEKSFIVKDKHFNESKKSRRNSTPFDPIIFGSLFIGFCLEKYYFSAPWRQTWSLNVLESFFGNFLS